MITRNAWLILVTVNCVVWAGSETSLKSDVEVTLNDVDVIRKTLEELATKPSIQFIEYGPDDMEGYKYHLSSGEDKEYILHTTGPIAVPIIESIRGTREERDRKLLARIITSTQIKSMDQIRRNSLASKSKPT